MLEIKRTNVAEILSKDNAHIIEEYAKESSLEELPKPKPRFDMYCKLEFTGAIECYGAYSNNKFAGFLVVMPTVIPHYGTLVLMVESVFVSSEYRKTGLGRLLLLKIEELAKEKKAWCILASAPVNSVLSKVLPKMGYSHTNNVLCKQIHYE